MARREADRVQPDAELANQMTEMMEKLEKSGGLFAVRQSTQEALQENGEIGFTLNLSYTPAGGEAQ